MGERKKEEVKPESLEEEIRELRKSLLNLLSFFLPPKEVREEVMRNVYTMELSFLRIFKTLLDYQIENLERRAEGRDRKRKAQKIEVE